MIRKIQEVVSIYFKSFSFRLTLLAILYLFSVNITTAQEIIIPPDYVFYQGDTLKGFDWKTVLDSPSAKATTPKELLLYLQRLERIFVAKKYNIADPVNLVSPKTFITHSIEATSPCDNVDFEDGNYTGWTGYIGENDNSNAALTQTVAGITTLGTNSAETSCSWHTLVTSGTDPYGNFPMLDAGGGTYACRLGGENINLAYKFNAAKCGTAKDAPNGGSMGEVIEETFLVTAANSMFTYNYAVVLDDAPHVNGEEPYFRVEVLNSAGDTIPCLQFYVQCQNNVPPTGFLTSGKTAPYDNSKVYYLPWTSSTVDLKPYIGTNITVRFTAAGCTQGGHFGYAYIDCSCSQVWPTVVPSCTSAVITAPPGGSSYSWTGPGVVSGGTTQSVTVNASGTYSVVVGLGTGKGCEYVLDTTISVAAPIVINTTSTPAMCTSTNGSASITSVTGGTTPYTYSWSNGQTTSTINNLTAGSYTVTVTDANKCTQTQTVVVSHNTATPTPTITPTDPPCSGGTGSAVATSITGGTAAYTYAWSNGKTTTSITGLKAGTYTLNITDANGCKGSGTVTITIPTAIVVKTSTTPTGCNGNTGTANVTSTTGGTPGYTYSWNSGQTTSTINGLGAGSYTVTVTDANNCTQKTTVVVGSTGATITPAVSSTNSLCSYDSTGSVSVTGVTGTGVPPYTYLWSSGQTTTTVTGLSSGTYTVTVKDNNGCVGSATDSVSAPTPIVPVSTASPAPCNGQNGSATITASGGTPGYTFLWNDGSTTSSISKVAGSYSVTITDNNGCTDSIIAVITQPSAMAATTEFVAANCGSKNGSAGVTSVSGGTTPYIYSWNTTPTQTTDTATNISAGNYTVTITDSNKCTLQVPVTVPNTGGPSDSIVSSKNILCFGGNNGSITLGVANGLKPYTFLWSNGAKTQNISGLVAGIYSVTVKDKNGCIATAIDTITQPPLLVGNIISVTNEKCFGDSIGSIVSSISGGTPGYIYSWSPAGGSGTTASNLFAGTYTLSVTDSNGCSIAIIDSVIQPPLLTLSAGAFPVSCHGECNGQLVSIPKGGTTQYSYLWSNGGTTASMLNVCAGTYSIVVTDANGCTADTTGLIISQPPALTGVTSVTTAYCNQADGGACIDSAGGGTPGYTYSWSNGATTSCLSNIKPATYTVIITDANKCKDTLKAVVPNAPGDTATIISSTNVTCYGGSDGSAVANGTGGTAPYTYSWSTTPSQTKDSATGLKAGSYTVTITDSKGCSANTVVTITQPTQVVTTPPAPQTICINQSALLTVTSVGGTPGYTYIWLPGNLTGASVIVTPTTTTTYTIITTDSKSCPGLPVTVVVTINPPLKVTVTPNKAVCPGGSATMSATASGGDGQYTYTWSPPVGLSCTGCQTTIITPTVTTQYTVTVTDKCGTPSVNDSVLISVNPVPVVNFKADTLQGCSPLCVNFTDQTTINPSMGFSSWAWTFGDGSTSTKQNPSHCYDSAGVFTVSLKVVSDSGCSDSLTIPNMITVYSHPVAAFTASPQPATIIQPTIYFTDQSTDAYGIKTWFWQFGNPPDSTSGVQNPQFTYADTGTYCPKLTVTNKHGCTDEVEHCIYIAPYFTLYIPNAFSPNGDGLNDVFTAKGTYVCNFEMYIFDRWGMLLYYTEDMNKGWDGRVNGGENIAQEDTYVYLITATDCIDHSKHRFVGRVTIVK